MGGLLNYTFFGNVLGTPEQIVNTGGGALVELPIDTTIEDPVPGNNSASDTDVIEGGGGGLSGGLRNGFEDALVNAASGSLRLPASRSVNAPTRRRWWCWTTPDGIGARVYLRSIEGEVQYALLATRGSNGLLRLGAWRSYAVNPDGLQSWTARPVATGWLLETVEMR